jgi:alpha-galactosidase
MIIGLMTVMQIMNCSLIRCGSLREKDWRFVYSKGLKPGIYSYAASLTCGGVTGSYNFEEQGARTFAKWGIDYLKYDYCNAPGDMVTALSAIKMGDALKKTNRPIVYSICEWGQLLCWQSSSG